MVLQIEHGALLYGGIALHHDKIVRQGRPHSRVERVEEPFIEVSWFGHLGLRSGRIGRFASESSLNHEEKAKGRFRVTQPVSFQTRTVGLGSWEREPAPPHVSCPPGIKQYRLP